MGYKQSKQNNKNKQSKQNTVKVWADINAPHIIDGYKVVSGWTLNTAIMRYFDTQKSVMLEKMEEATTDGERLGFAGIINLLGNYTAQSKNMDALYVLNMEKKHPIVYQEMLGCAVLEESIVWMGNNRIIGPNADYTGATSIHYNTMYRTIQDRQHDEFRGLVAKKLCSRWGLFLRKFPHHRWRHMTTSGVDD
jgi:hypothetical protein